MGQDTDSAAFDAFERQSSFSRRQWELLGAAVRLLDRVGISEFTMRGLADEIGLSPMAAYKHFENQRALQLELWRECQNHFYDRLLESTRDAADPAAGFLALCRAFAEYAVEYPYRSELLYNHPFVREIVEIAPLEEQRQSAWVFARELVERAQSAGLFRADQPADVLLLAAASQVRGLAATIIYARMAAFGDLSPAAMIDVSLGFIRDALIAR